VVVRADAEPHPRPHGAGWGAGDDKDGTPLLTLSSPSNDEDEDDAAEEVCSLLSRTEIPDLIEHLIALSPPPTVEWTQDSLEDACLGTMFNMMDATLKH
jgi:hypothetical protein